MSNVQILGVRQQNIVPQLFLTKCLIMCLVLKPSVAQELIMWALSCMQLLYTVNVQFWRFAMSDQNMPYIAITP